MEHLESKQGMRDNYKGLYTGIFSIYYFAEGLNLSILTIIVPIYILTNAGSVGAGRLGELGSIAMLPWAIKFIYGILGDKLGTEKFGRRRLWTFFPGIIGGIAWAISPILLANSTDFINTFLIIGIIGGFGFAIGDTAVDGFMLDICPSEKLGRVQGFCWGFRSIGTISGGPVLSLAVILLNFPIELVFIIFGSLTIISSSLIWLIKEPKLPEKFKMGELLKDMFKGEKNWKLYLHSIVYNLTEGVLFLYLALYIMIQMGLITPESATLTVLEEDINLYIPQAYINLIIGAGIIAGSLFGGYLADKKSRRVSAYLSYIVSLISTLLLLLRWGIVFLFIVSIFCGVGLGWRNSSYSPILGEYSKDYPEMDATYFSIGNSFSNIGSSLGLMIIGRLFNSLGEAGLNYVQVYNTVFVTIAIMIAISPLTFSFLKRKYYEIDRKSIGSK